MSPLEKIPVLLLSAVLLLAGSSPARELGGVRMPDRVVVAKKTLVLNGMGVRKATILKISVYVAGLYLESPSKDPTRVLDSAEVKRLTLHFVRDVSREQVTDAWSEGFEKNAGKRLRALEPRIRRLNGWMRAFRSGDTLTFTSTPGTGVTVDVSGAVRGTIEGDDFTRALLSIWLGPDPPNASLKSGLLGKE